MDKQELEELIDQHLSIRQIADKTGKSPTSIRYWLKKHGLKTKIARFNRGGKPEEFQVFLCSECGEDDPDKFYQARSRCKTCHNKRQHLYVLETKKKAVEYKGGKCQRCGYNKNYAALDFHHLDPDEKDLNYKTARHWSWERLKVELDKCELVCRNCHAEIHHPTHEISGCGLTW